MELGHSVGPHQPDEAVVWVAPLDRRQRVDRVARASLPLEFADLDARALGLLARRFQPRFTELAKR